MSNDACVLAQQLMADELPRRWRHVQAVAHKANQLATAFDAECAVRLVAAAWLHDIGYAAPAVDTGFHPLDGARFLRSRGEAQELCCLVANHSGAQLEAQYRYLADGMSQFPDQGGAIRDAVWSCDMTTGPSGDSVSFSERLEEIQQRYPTGHTVPLAIANSADEIQASILRTNALTAKFGVEVDLRV